MWHSIPCPDWILLYSVEDIFCLLQQVRPHHIICYRNSVLIPFAVSSWIIPITWYHARLCGEKLSTHYSLIVARMFTAFWNMLETGYFISVQAHDSRHISMISSLGGQYMMWFWLVQTFNWNIFAGLLYTAFPCSGPSRWQESCVTEMFSDPSFYFMLRPEFTRNVVPFVCRPDIAGYRMSVLVLTRVTS
jgi:hypothetical protein